MILLGFLATNFLVANSGWTAENDFHHLLATSSAWIYLPLILNNFLVPTPAQKAAILGAEMVLLASDEGS